MKKYQLLSVAAVLLFLLGIVMLIIGAKATILPPAITGVGFVVIGYVLLALRK